MAELTGSPDADLRVRGPHIADERFDDEVMILDLTVGNYFSLAGVGAEVWGSIREGRGRAEIVDGLLARYRADPGVIESAAETFLAELEAEGLIAQRPDDRPSGAQRAGTGDREFVVPELQKYTDMQALLLIDPIHATDDRGWPHVPKGEEA